MSASLPGATVIAGAGGELGAALAKAFAARGGALALLSPEPEGWSQSLRQQLEAAGRACFVGTLPPAGGEAADALLGAIARALGPVETLVTNLLDVEALLYAKGEGAALAPLHLRKATSALDHLIGAASRGMQKRRRGQVVNLLSVLGRGGGEDQVLGTAAAAAINLSQAWALLLAPQGIRVNALCPTPLIYGQGPGAGRLSPRGRALLEEIRRATPLRRVPSFAAVAEAAAFLASDGAAIVTGQAWNLCGGYRMN